MMTYEQVLAMAEALGEDATVSNSEGEISVEFNNFEGFDDDWSAIARTYDNPKAVRAFEKMLQDEALSVDDYIYLTYYFDGFTVEIDYASDNI